MRRPLLSALLALAPGVGAAQPDPFEFLASEAGVATASRRMEPPRHSPATAYVLTREEIRASGVLTIWDALRLLPGVDVVSPRAFQGEVGIRGMAQPLAKRVLVLLDGKTVLNGYFDFLNWEGIPVTLEEIERIEVVQGPASALYGAGAVSGVINIITRAPGAIDGAEAGMTAGERGTYLGGARAGAVLGPWAYKFGLGLRATNRFDDASRPASRAGKIHAFASREVGGRGRLSLSGGGTDMDTQLTTGSSGLTYEDGLSAFLRGDYEGERGRLRAFWNRGRTRGRELVSLGEPRMDYDTYDLEAQRDFALPGGDVLTAGAGYRKNVLRSTLFPGAQSQDLWSLFFEQHWGPLPDWTVTASGRLDRHPFTGLRFSPRASLLYSAGPRHDFRFSAGTAYRNPSLLENYSRFTQTLPSAVPGFDAVETTIVGERGLRPERMLQFELAHTGRWGPVRTTAVGFHYLLEDQIVASAPATLSAVPPLLRVRQSFENRGRTAAWGGELGLDARVRAGVSTFANYSLQSLRDTDAGQVNALTAPRHKANAGVRARTGGFSGMLWARWVDKTFWPTRASSQPPVQYRKVAGYLVLNVRAGYEFSGAWEGLEVVLSSFNLADKRHPEVLPAQEPGLPGQSGEVLGARTAITVNYRFQ